MEKLIKEESQFHHAFDFAFKQVKKSKSKEETARKLLKELFPEIQASQFSLEEIKRVYYERVWLHNKYDQIENNRISRKLFDFSCNLDLKRSNILLQRALNSGWNSKLKVDGKMGDREILLINEIEDQENSDILEGLICHYAANFYEIFGDRDHIQYLLQWVFR